MAALIQKHHQELVPVVACKTIFLAEPDDDLKCLICFEVARDPLQHEACGKLYCRTCLEKYGREQPCPNCREEESHYYVDNRSRRAIEALRVKCSNVEMSCAWEGTLSTLSSHVITCQFTSLPCPKQCRDQDSNFKQVMRKDLDDHLKNHCPLRDYQCQYCGEKGTYTRITNAHDLVCDKKVVSCVNSGCLRMMQRCKVQEHVKLECAYTMLSCKYESLGCSEKARRQDIAAHEENSRQQHLDLAMETTVALKEKISELEAFKERSEASIVKLGRALATLTSSMEKVGRVEEDQEVDEKLGHVFEFSIVNYKKKKAGGKSFKSQPFYTAHLGGYHLSIEVIANGAAPHSGTHVSVFMHVKTGRYDSTLKWPIVGHLTFSLLNQRQDKNHHSMTLHILPEYCMRQGKSLGYCPFISHEDLEYNSSRNTHYLVNDTLKFRIYFKPA